MLQMDFHICNACRGVAHALSFQARPRHAAGLLALALLTAHGEASAQAGTRDAAGEREPRHRIAVADPSEEGSLAFSAEGVQLRVARRLQSMPGAAGAAHSDAQRQWGPGDRVASAISVRPQLVSSKHFVPAAEERFRTPLAADSTPAAQASLHRVAVDDLTLLNAVGIAIARHPAISRAKAVIAQGTSEVSIAKAAWYPKIEYGIRPGYGGNFGSQGNRPGARATVGVSQLVYDFGRTTNRIAAADAALERQQHQLADVVETTANDTAVMFIELAASQKVVEAARRQIVTLRETRVKIVERVEAGLSAVSDRNLIDVAIQRAQADAFKADARFDVAAAKIAEVIGLRPRHVADLEQTGRQVHQLGNESEDIERTPAVLAASAAVDAADATLKVAEAELYPAINIGVNHARSTGRSNAADDTWIGLSLSGNFPFGGLAKHRVEAAQAERLAAAEMLESQRLLARTALFSARAEETSVAARLESQQKIIELSRSSRDLYWQEYTLNKRPLTEVINPDRDIYQAEVELANAVADGLLARIKAHVAAGRFVELLRQQDIRI